jgi:hypothetical protein
MNKSLQENAPTLATDTAYTEGIGGWWRNVQIGSLAKKVDMPNVPGAGFLGGVMGGLGNDGTLRRGREIELAHTPAGPLRDALLQQNFEANKRDEIRQLVTPGGPGGMPYAGTGTGAAQLNRARTSTFDVATESAKYPSLTGADVAAAMTETNSLLREQNRLLAQAGKAALKPGGGKANAEEAL